jgi:hypothetical protein
VTVALIIAALAGCSGNTKQRSGNTSQEQELVLVMPERARYAEEIEVPPEFAKCKLEQKVASVVRKAARKGYAKVITKPVVQPSQPGNVLTLQITNVSSVDRALYDSRSLTIQGVIYVDGKEQTSFMARRRSSRRGLHVSSTCNMLGNSIEAIEADLKKWFAKPVPHARLGDL